MSIKIVHAADFHIGASLSHLGTQLAKQRGDEIRQSLIRVADFCKEKEVDALIIAGDIFDTHKPTKADSEFVKNTLSSLRDIPVYIIAGNHDYISSQSPFAKEDYFSENVHIFPCYESSFELPEKSTVFWGKSYGSKTAEPSFDECIFDKDKINIMLLHGDMTQSSSFNIITQETLMHLDPSYAAFGHIHAGEIFSTGNIKCAYSGAVEGHSFSDCGKTGIIYAEISKSETVLTQIDFSLRKYMNISVDITGKSEKDIINKAKILINTNDFFRLDLVGECMEGNSPDIQYIKNELQDFAFYIDVTDSSSLGYDFDMIEKEESLRGAFLRELRKKTHTEEDFIRSAKIGLDALSGRVPSVGGAL